MNAVRVEMNRPGVKRLAIIISNDYSHDSELTTLSGTNYDNEAMVKAFRSQDDFGVVRVQNNATTEVIKDIVPYAVSLSKLCQSFECIAIVFSGHGGEGRTILSISKNNKRVNFEEAFIRPLWSLKEEVAKLVFIDACRGRRELKGNTSQGESLDGVVLPERTMIAYSTMPHHRSYDNPGQGSLWMQTLAWELEISYEKNMAEIVLKANNDKKLKLQKPQYINNNCTIRLKGKYIVARLASLCV